MTQQMMKAVEDRVGDAAPGYLKCLFPLCGGPVGTMETFSCLIPSDKRDDVMSAIAQYRQMQDSGGGDRSGGGCLDCCCRGYQVEPAVDPKLRSPPCCLVVGGFFLQYFLVCCILSFAMSPLSLFLCFCFAACAALLFSECLAKQSSLLPLFGGIGLVTLMLAGFVGATNHRLNYGLYRAAEAGRHYEGISPADKAIAHADAGTISFVNPTLNTYNSLGLTDGDTMFCVAPIMTDSQSAVHESAAVPVQFWAVGTDCCRRHTGFSCDDAHAQDVKGGIVLPEPEYGLWVRYMAPLTFFSVETHWEKYAEAIDAAAALHGLKTTTSPVLVYWVKDPEEILDAWRTQAILVVVFSSLVYLACITTTWFFVHLFYARRIRVLLGLDGGTPSDKTDSSERASQEKMRDPFLVYGSNPM